MKIKEYQQFIFGNIFLLSNKLQILGDQVTGDITLKQWFVLIMIRNMENTQPNLNDIAEMNGTSRQNISRIISALQKKEMVKLHQSKSDQRSSYVKLTDRSHRYFVEKEDLGNLFLDDLFTNITDEETIHAAEALRKLLENAEMQLKKK